MNTQQDTVDERWKNAFGMYYYKKENKDAEIIQCFETKKYYVKFKVLQEINGCLRYLKTFFINAKEYL